jgi:hypothetical protein
METPNPDQLVWAFPMPANQRLKLAFQELYLAANGTDRERLAIGDPALLPRPWDPATITDPALRAATWIWLDDVVTWFNHEHVWDLNAGCIPPCWPQHPHLIHEIGVLADQRRRAAIALTSDNLEDWHRYTAPGFLTRKKERLHGACEDHHQPWPARGRHARLAGNEAGQARVKAFSKDARSGRA